MSLLWVPPTVSRELKESTAQYRAELRDVMHFQTPVCAEWSAVLQKIDPYLRLGKATDSARAVGVKPGFYHLVRLNPEAPPWVQPLTGRDGEFIEPSSRMLDDLRASDLQSARAVAERKAREERAERERLSAEAREDADRRQEILERFKSLEDVSVSMSGTKRVLP